MGSSERVHWLEALSCEVQLAVMEFVDGRSAVRAGVAIRGWRGVLLSSCARCEQWWRETTIRELGAPGLRGSGGATGWRERYARLQCSPARARWAAATSRHGLRDRVAAPQMFVSAEGRRLFCYGGWTRLGPQTDLHCCDLSRLEAACPGWGARLPGPSSAARGVRFERCGETGRPVSRGGVQTLTPLWAACGGRDGPSRAHVARALRVEDARDYELVVAFGGAGGGYQNEHNDWRVAGVSSREKAIAWTTIGRRRRGTATPGEEVAARCAHTATYVPARYCEPRHAEGCVLVVGGHTADCSRSLDTVDCLDVATWSWDADVARAEPRLEARHGHSATLVVLDRRAYLVVAGGGTGNILHGFGDGIHEFDDCWVLDCRDKRWLDGPLPLGAVFGRHHTASPALHGRALLFGGGARPGPALGLLDARACVRHALAKRTTLDPALLLDLAPPAASREEDPSQTTRAAPAPRKMHAAACLLPWLPLFVCFGGWEFGPHFSDLWIAKLETEVAPYDSPSPTPVPTPLAATLDDRPRDDEDDEDDDDDDDDDDDNHLVTLSINTDHGTHQIQVPRRVFHRLVRDGLLGLTAHPQQHH